MMYRYALPAATRTPTLHTGHSPFLEAPEALSTAIAGAAR